MKLPKMRATFSFFDKCLRHDPVGTQQAGTQHSPKSKKQDLKLLVVVSIFID